MTMIEKARQNRAQAVRVLAKRKNGELYDTAPSDFVAVQPKLKSDAHAAHAVDDVAATVSETSILAAIQALRSGTQSPAPAIATAPEAAQTVTKASEPLMLLDPVLPRHPAPLILEPRFMIKTGEAVTGSVERQIALIVDNATAAKSYLADMIETEAQEIARARSGVAA